MDSTGVHVDVVTSQPIKDKEPKKKFVSVEGERDWSTGPYACFPDFPSCCRGFCCIPCMMSEISQRLGEWMCFPFFMPGGGNVLRTRVRTMGGIKGTACDDCIMMCFCGACAVWQMQRELDEMGIPKV
ncbi:cornifelin [Magallana gigas]|uniref:PLAC8-like protein 1 n=1 Tax=Magallana gigas TaxID=29159 RepID=A0A8W8JML0_MAGGI|nr:cornifelin-like [Crassostrea gigas]